MSKITERDVQDLNDAIKTERAAAQVAHTKVDEVIEAERKAGFNIAGTSEADKEAFNRIDAARKVASTHEANAAEAERRLNAAMDEMGRTAASQSGGDPDHPAMVAQAQSLGAIVAESAAHKEFLASGQLDTSPNSVKYSPVEVLSKEQTRQFLATGTYTADAGDGSPLVPTDERMQVVGIPKRMPTLLDLITMSSTGRDAVSWKRQLARVTAGTTTVPFGTALNKSRYTYESVISPVLRKGHYAIVDEGNIADSDEFRGLIDDELLSDLRLILEDDALNGSGGATEWTGIYNASGIGEVAGLDVSRPDALHKAMTLVRVQLEREPNGVGISPVDFEEFYLEKGNDGHYLHHRGPSEGGPETIWGKRTSISVAYSSPLVADFARAATMWVRQGVNIAVDRINDQFIEGEWTIRAQARAAFAVKQAKAIAVVNGYGTTT